MEQILSFVEGAFLHLWVIVIAAVVLLLYHFASRAIKKLPKLPIKLLFIYLVLKAIFLSLPEGMDSRLKTSFDVAAAITFYCAFVQVVFVLIIESWYRWRKKAAVPKITRDLVLSVSYVVITLVILRTRGGANPLSIVGTSAILTGVIGLSAQNILGNFLSGFMIQMEHPFNIGDWIECGGHTGRVISIGWESIRLLTFDEEMIIIPNQEISKTIIRNHSKPTLMHAMKIDVGVEYPAAPSAVRKVFLDVCRNEPFIRRQPDPVVRLVNFGDFAITYQIRFFYDDFGMSPDIKALVMDKIWYALRRANIQIPYPIRDLRHKHVERKFEEELQTRVRTSAESLLNTVPILKPLTEEARNAIAKGMKVENFGNGEIVVRQGDSGDSLYILSNGNCDIEVINGNKNPTKVASLNAPAFFGEMSLLTGEPRSATVRASGDITVFSIDKELFKNILVAHPEISNTLAKALAERHAENQTMSETQKAEAAKQATKILSKIKSFFGLL